jgi:small neutral amino acid transporter SnatA (MarC family)
MRLLWRAGLALALLLMLAFGVLAPPERCPQAGPAELRRSAQAAADWLVRNQAPAGTWLYLYDADSDSAAPASEYNVVRHAGVAMALYQAAAEGLPGALRSADRGTEWASDRMLERDGWAAFGSDGRYATGASALLAAGLVTRREVTGDERYDDLMRRLGRFVLAQTEPSGAVLAEYDPARGAPVPGEYSKYFTGEAYMALARLERAFPGEGWGAAARRIGAYLATERDDAEDHWPAIPDHWAAYGMAEAGVIDAGYARSQAGLFGLQVRMVAQGFGPWGKAVRGSYEPRGGGYGVIGEGLTGLWLAAREDPRLGDLTEPIAERTLCNAGLAVEAQSDREDAAGASEPGRIAGAWFVDGETRMDDQQHALAALLRTIPIAQATQAREATDPDGDAPSALLWAAALLLALNPARAAFAVPRARRAAPKAVDPADSADPDAGRAEREVVELAALGGLIGGLAVCVAAALGAPLLDLLDVSDPSFRIAAGLVAVIAGAGDLFRRPPASEPVLEGRRAALVPVAVPAVARPALLVMALGAGADIGVLVAAAAMLIGVALLTALAAGGPPEGPRGRALRWAARLLAALLVACGILLAVDGVLDV